MDGVLVEDLEKSAEPLLWRRELKSLESLKIICAGKKSYLCNCRGRIEFTDIDDAAKLTRNRLQSQK